MSNAFRRFFGGSPGWVIVRLAIISLIVGLVLSALNIQPLDIVHRIERLVRGLWEMGFDAVVMLWNWLLMGALVVVPIWLILRILNTNRRGP